MSSILFLVCRRRESTELKDGLGTILGRRVQTIRDDMARAVLGGSLIPLAFRCSCPHSDTIASAYPPCQTLTMVMRESSAKLAFKSSLAPMVGGPAPPQRISLQTFVVATILNSCWIVTRIITPTNTEGMRIAKGDELASSLHVPIHRVY